jgi:hypothetical protein
MEYYLQLLEALDEYEDVISQEPRIGVEDIYYWSVRCAKVERRIEQLTEILTTSEPFLSSVPSEEESPSKR